MLHLDAKIILFLQIMVVIGLPLFLWRPLRLGRFFPLPIIQILAGIVLGPSVFGALSGFLAKHYGITDVFELLFRSELSPGLTARAGIETLANVATVLFIFLAGCEADRGIIRKSGAMVLKIGTAGVFLPWVLGTLAALLIAYAYPRPSVVGTLHNPTLYAVAFGLCMAVSALPVLVVVLRELGFNTKPIGSIALAIGGIDDGLLWLSLSVLLPFAAAAADGHGDPVRGAVTAIAGLVFTIVALWFVIAPFLDWLLKGEAQERLMVSTMILALFFAATTTEASGLHAAIGAFLTGLIIPDRLRHLALVRLDVPVNLLLLPFLFLSTGLNTSFAFNDPTVWIIMVVALIVCVGGKFVGITLPAILAGQSRAFSITLGTLMQCKGLMEIVVVTVLFQRGVIGQATFSALVLTSLVSTAMTVPMARLCERMFGEAATTPAPERQAEISIVEPNLPIVQMAPAAEVAIPAVTGPALMFEEGLGSFPVNKPELVIGRHSQDDVRINNIQVSRHHARLRDIGGGRYEIDNLTAVRSEPNPMLVNGIEREKAPLADGDVVSLGGLSFTFKLHGEIPGRPADPVEAAAE